MMEFGSDFNLINYPKGDSFKSLFGIGTNFYASGRQALVALAIARKWERLWVPSYFCEESLACFRHTKIEISKYPCLPTDNPESAVGKIPASCKDGILVVNYFGLHGQQKFENEAEIVEDHTHDLLGTWCSNSSSDWCIASLRKTLPVADGGILWSPKGRILPKSLETTDEVSDVMSKRYQAMLRKSEYLSGAEISKNTFLDVFRETEDAFDSLVLSGISHKSLEILSNFDIREWYEMKRRNYEELLKYLNLQENIKVLSPLHNQGYAFSLCLLFDSTRQRDSIRNFLIENSVYPAILWQIESTFCADAIDLGRRILSIHCDGRYSTDDMQELARRINLSFIS